MNDMSKTNSPDDWLSDMTVREIREIVDSAYKIVESRTKSPLIVSWDIRRMPIDDYFYMNSNGKCVFVRPRDKTREELIEAVYEGCKQFPTRREALNREIMESVEKLKKVSNELDPKLSASLDAMIDAIVNNVASNLIEDNREKTDA